MVLDVHHFDELCSDVDRHRDRFLALWSQIAERYAAVGGRLSFELLNEPHPPMTADQWNELLPEALRLVRAEAERLGIGWAYWDFATDFGAFDLARDRWRAPLRRALLGE